MGITNRDNALYWATGIDNTGLHKGREEAMGILKGLASQVTSFDIFGGVGVSAAMAFAKAAKSSYDFEKQFQQSMKEVATLSSGMKGSLTEWMNQLVSLTTQIPVSANDAAKALYQIVSAGYDGAKGIEILETAAKAAIGGVTDTATAADTITTVLNSYKMDASEAGKVSDQLFTTVKLGKTTFGELGQSISQAAPLAASFGIDIEEVLAAVASLTKQGVPTAQAMTQIRAAITGAANELGDAAFEGRTFQDTMQAIYDKAGGSTTKMKEMMGSIEGVNAALGVTGSNALSAARDLYQLRDSTGAAEEAFKEMVDSATNQMTLLSNNITATLRPMGTAILKEVSDISKALNTAFTNGDMQKSMETMGQLIIAVTGALVGYKGSIIAVSAAKSTATIIANILHREQIKEAASLVLNKGLYAAKATAVAKSTSAHILLTNALKAQFAQMMKNTAAMMTNPYVLAGAAVAALGVGLYHLATRLSAAEQAQKKYNDSMDAFNKKQEDKKQRIENLIRVIQDETETVYEQIRAYEELQRLSPALTAAYTREEIAVLDSTKAQRTLNEERDKTNYSNIIANVNKYTETLAKARAEAEKLRTEAKSETDLNKIHVLNNLAFGQELSANKAEKELAPWKKSLDEYNRLKKQAEEDAKPIEIKILEAQNNRDQIAQEFAAAKLALEEEQKKIQESGFGVVPIQVQLRFDNAKEALGTANKKIESVSNQGKRIINDLISSISAAL